MRLKRNYIKAIKRSFSWLASRFKPLTVHTEAIMIDSVWEKIKEEVNKNKVLKWYVMTPANIDYFRSEFNVKMPKKKLSKIMKDRYRWMLKQGQKLELHIHLSLVMDNISDKEQEKLFSEAISWTKKELRIDVKEFAPGWWVYNKDTIKICRKFKLKIIRERDYDFTHDYHWV